MSDEHGSAVDEQRSAWPDGSWHNLFYDLAFVAAIIVLSAAFGFEYTVSSAVWITTIFAVFWSIWLITSLVMNQMPVGPLRVGLVAVQMAFILSAAVGAGGAVSSVVEFAGPLVGAALLSVAVLIAVGWRDEGAQKRWRSVGLLAAAGAMFSIGWYAPNGVLLIPVAVALIGFVTWHLLRHSGESAHTFTHRFGELTMVVLGETFVKVGLSDESNGLTRFRISALILIMLVITTMWWAYFGVVVRGDAGGSGDRRTAWAMLHLPLQLGLVFLAVGLAKLLADSKSLAHSGVSWLVLAPFALAVASLAGLALVGSGARGRVTAECMGAASALIVIVAVAAPHIDALSPVLATWLAVAPLLIAVVFLHLRLVRRAAI